MPSKLLLEQWAEQVRELPGAREALAGSGHDRWKRGGALRGDLDSYRQERPIIYPLFRLPQSQDCGKS